MKTQQEIASSKKKIPIHPSRFAFARGMILGGILTLSLSTLVTQASVADGVFGDYFTRIVSDAAGCGTNTAISGFDTNPATYGTQKCTTFQNIVKSVLGITVAPAGQAVIGINTDGSLKFGVVGDNKWSGTAPGDIYYTGTLGNVGIGTSAPTYKLDVNGDVRTSGNTQAKVFFDGDNGAYYLDPNGTGKLNAEEINAIGIGGAPENASWGVSIHKDGWAIVTRQGNGADNTTAKDPVGSIYANDVYLRSVGKWVSEMSPVDSGGSGSSVYLFKSSGLYTIDTEGYSALYIQKICGGGGGGAGGTQASGGETARAGADGFDGECLDEFLLAGSDYMNGDILTVSIGSGGLGSYPQQRWTGNSWVFKRQASVAQPGKPTILYRNGSPLVKARGGGPGEVDNCNTDSCVFAGYDSVNDAQFCYWRTNADIIGGINVSRVSAFGFRTLGYCGKSRVNANTCNASYLPSVGARSTKGGLGGGNEEPVCGNERGYRGQDGGSGMIVILAIK